MISHLFVLDLLLRLCASQCEGEEEKKGEQPFGHLCDLCVVRFSTRISWRGGNLLFTDLIWRLERETEVGVLPSVCVKSHQSKSSGVGSLISVTFQGHFWVFLVNIRVSNLEFENTVCVKSHQSKSSDGVGSRTLYFELTSSGHSALSFLCISSRCQMPTTREHLWYGKPRAMLENYTMYSRSRNRTTLICEPSGKSSHACMGIQYFETLEQFLHKYKF